MNSSRQNIERLAILNAKVTSAVVLLNLATAFVVFSLKTFEALSLVIFVTGTIGGAASNYRRLQEAYVQQLSKANKASASSTTKLLEEGSAHLKAPIIDEESTDAEPETIKVVESTTPKSPPIDDEAVTLLLGLQIFLSPIFGGLFAFVLYGVFASGIIQGEIFPRFQSTDEEYTTPYEFADKTIPETNGDVAKAILWGFIAGFTEGFVPNFIDRLVKNAEQEDNS